MFYALKFTFALLIFLATFKKYGACPCTDKSPEPRFYLVLEYTRDDGEIRRWTLQGVKGLESVGVRGFFSSKKNPVEIDINNTSQKYIIVANDWLPALEYAVASELYAQLAKCKPGTQDDMTMGIASGGGNNCDCNEKLKSIHENPTQLTWKTLELEKAPEVSIPYQTVTAVFHIVDKTYVFRDNVPKVADTSLIV